MVRAYVRKRPRQWRDKDKRMEAAVRLRTQGRSLREIGAVLAVDASTVLRDLRRWDEKQAAAAPSNVLQMRVANGPRGGELQQPNATDVATPIPLARRK